MKAPAGSFSIQMAAKVLMSYGIDTGEKLFFAWLRKRGYLDASNVPYDEYLRHGLFKVCRGSFDRSGKKEFYIRTFITDKGLIKIKEELNTAKKVGSYIYSGLGPLQDINELKI